MTTKGSTFVRVRARGLEKVVAMPAHTHCKVGLLTSLLGLAACSVFESGSEVPNEKTSCVEDLEAAKQVKFETDADLGARVSATLVGTVVLAEGADKADEDLARLCESLARDLGGDVKSGEGTPGERAKPTCAFAMEQVKAAREKAGATLVTELQAPLCSARLTDFENCAQECDPNLPPGFKMGCLPEATSGRCERKCTGTCVEPSTDDCEATCRGACQGKCMEGFFGTCGGKCFGDCDGKTSNGKCAGTCDGKCTSDANGSCEKKCEGKCAGACLAEVRSKKCDGSCVGKCSDPMSDLRCGEFVPPDEMAPECRAQCDVQLASRLSCSAGHADVTVFSAAERDKAEQLRAALSRSFTNALTLEHGSVARLKRASEGLMSSLDTLDETSAQNPSFKKKMQGCLEAARERQQKATASLDAFAEASAALVESTRQ